MTNGIGTVVSTTICTSVLESLGTRTTLHLLASVAVAFGASCSLFLEMPIDDSAGQTVASDAGDEHSGPRSHSQLSLKKILSMRAFWQYILSVISAQVSSSFIMGYFSIGSTFGISQTDLVKSFQRSYALSTFLRPLGGYLADVLKYGSGYFSLGSKNLFLIILLSEWLILLEMSSASARVDFKAMNLAIGAMFVIYPFVLSAAPVLACDIFGTRNRARVFGLGGSFAMGFGNFSFLSFLSTVAPPSDNRTPEAYNRFYFTSAGIIVTGLISCASLRKVIQEDWHIWQAKSPKANSATVEVEEPTSEETTALVVMKSRHYDSVLQRCSAEHLMKTCDPGGTASSSFNAPLICEV